jgi:hypothetical protein
MKKRREGRTVKKRLVLAVGVLAISVCILAVWINLSKPGGITLDSYDQIQVGMTRQQVEEILGGPPRNESALIELLHFDNWFESPVWPEEWLGSEIAIYVKFDAQERVCDKRMETHEFGPAPSPIWDKARSWLPW